MIGNCLLMFIIAVGTVHLISDVGKVTSEYDSVDYKYSCITFKDDRDTPLTMNFFMNIFIPNIIMVFLYMISCKFRLIYIRKHLILYIIFVYVYRWILINVLLEREELYSRGYEFIMASIGVVIAALLIKFYLNDEEVIILTADEFRNEIWLIIFAICYKFIKIALDKKTIQSKIIKPEQIKKYIIKKYTVYSRKYDCNIPYSKNSCQYKFLYSIMIYEDFNRGRIIRVLERMKIKTGKRATVGIMQMESDRYLSDIESIKIFVEKLDEEVDIINSEIEQEENKEELMREKILELSCKHNQGLGYSSNIKNIYKIIESELEK